jgi:hypothetical protein
MLKNLTQEKKESFLKERLLQQLLGKVCLLILVQVLFYIHQHLRHHHHSSHLYRLLPHLQ